MLSPELAAINDELQQEIAPARSEEALALYFASIHE